MGLLAAETAQVVLAGVVRDLADDGGVDVVDGAIGEAEVVGDVDPARVRLVGRVGTRGVSPGSAGGERGDGLLGAALAPLGRLPTKEPAPVGVGAVPFDPIARSPAST